MPAQASDKGGQDGPGAAGPPVLAYAPSTRARSKAAGVWLCTRCGHAGTLTRYVTGSRNVELLLWTLGLVPGLVYRIWRWSTQFDGCPNCRSQSMIPLIGKRRTDYTQE